MLPEKLRDKYTGTMESLYGIIEESLSASISEDSSSDDDDEEMEERSNLVGVDDEEEEAPAPRPSIKSKKTMFKSKPKENSVKPMFRKKQ